jgi:hypothetical protein
MGSPTNSGERPKGYDPVWGRTPLPNTQGLDGPFEDPRATPQAEGDLEELGDDFDLIIWAEDFRQGSSEIDLCGGCGRPTGIYLALGEWVEHPVTCAHCLAEGR